MCRLRVVDGVCVLFVRSVCVCVRRVCLRVYVVCGCLTSETITTE